MLLREADVFFKNFAALEQERGTGQISHGVTAVGTIDGSSFKPVAPEVRAKVFAGLFAPAFALSQNTGNRLVAYLHENVVASCPRFSKEAKQGFGLGSGADFKKHGGTPETGR